MVLWRGLNGFVAWSKSLSSVGGGGGEYISQVQNTEVEIQNANSSDTLNNIFAHCHASVILDNFRCFVFKNMGV